MRYVRRIAALGACLVLFGTLGALPASADIWEADKFGIATFTNTFEDPFGGSPLVAGGHPDVRVRLDFVENGKNVTAGQIRDIEVDQPAGFYGNPQAVPTCDMAQLIANDGLCDPAAQVGVFLYDGLRFPVYSMQTPDEQTAVLAVVILSFPAKIVITSRTDGDFGLTAKLSNINQALPLTHSTLTLWGAPADPVHDPDRMLSIFSGGAHAEIPVKPFLTLPPRCEPMTTTIRVRSWQGLSDTASETTPPLEGCEDLEFQPSLKARPTTDVADSPSGLEAVLHIPQNLEDPDQPSSALPKTVEATLPEGLVINPSGGNGLEGCSPGQIGLTTPVGAGDPLFTKAKGACPDASGIGRVEVDTPAFPDPLEGRVYTMTPHDNPFGTLLGIYLVIEGHGLIVKQAGKVIADPRTGRLTTTFDQIPQLPFENIRLDFDGGAVGILRTPATCGPYATTSTITAWSSPETPAIDDKDTYAINRAPNGQGCASSEAQLPHSPSFEGGTTDPIAGLYRPFGIHLTRNDGTQQLTGIDATLPPGLLAKLAGTTYCSDAALAAATQKDGKAEQATPSCPAASRVGSVIVGAGAGPRPFYAPATAYLAGPYKGAPLSLAVVAPAVAGPFDLGTVVVRNALYVDPTTAQVHAVSDRFPSILQGIPLDVRSVDLRLDRPEFTKNPTSCDPFAIAGFAQALSGQSAPISSRFQVGECGRLKFKPKLSLKFKGKTKRTGNPALTAVLKAPPGQANIAKTTVILPKTQFIDNAHISNPCTRVQFDANACPPGSVLGHARAFTPLLDQPLEGPVYFRSNGGARELPDMVVDLGGQIPVTLVGYIDSVKVKGTESSRVRTRFTTVPDAPVSKFVLNLKGGKKGLIENSVNLCNSPQRATVQMQAHNAATKVFEQPIGTSCGKGKRQKKSGKR
jgi:hypothetical protein